MSREVRLFKLGWGTIGDVGRALEDMDHDGSGREKPDHSRWQIFMEMVHMVFETGELASE